MRSINFIGPAAAFLALGLIGLACMAAAALHGPALAGLGLAGSLVTPLLVQSTDRAPWTLVIYIGVVAPGLRSRAARLAVAVAGRRGRGAAACGPAHAVGGVEHAFFRAAMAHIVVQTALAALFMALCRLGCPRRSRARPIAAAVALAVLPAVRSCHSGGRWCLVRSPFTVGAVLLGDRPGDPRSAALLPGLRAVIPLPAPSRWPVW